MSKKSPLQAKVMGVWKMVWQNWQKYLDGCPVWTAATDLNKANIKIFLCPSDSQWQDNHFEHRKCPKSPLQAQVMMVWKNQPKCLVGYTFFLNEGFPILGLEQTFGTFSVLKMIVLSLAIWWTHKYFAFGLICARGGCSNRVPIKADFATFKGGYFL